MALRARDIAKMLGVSTSTMSLVINNKPGVSDAKRQEILQKIQELDCGYLLRDVRKERASIGFVVYKRKGSIVDESPFFSYFLEGITERLKNLNYNLTMLYMSSNMSRAEQEQVIKNAHCEGFILFAVEMLYEDMQVFKDSRYPFVMLDNSFMVNDVDTVAINNASGIRTAVNHLIQRGHRRIGYIRSKVIINAFTDRFSAYRHTLTKAGLPINDDDVAWVRYSDMEARQDMRQYAESAASLPTAFVSDNDLVACGAMKGLQDAGYSIPEDVSIIGFDDRPIAAMSTPQLTTMMVPKDVFGNNCVDLLINKIRTPRPYAIKMEIGTILVERESVRKIQ